MTDHNKGEAVPVGRKGLVDDTVSEPVPEKELPDNFEPAMPGGNTLAWSLTEDKVFPGKTVKIEPAEAENRVVKVMLKRNNNLRKRIKRKHAVVICRE